jgi:hypothetical protein
MSDSSKTPFEPFFEEIRRIVREEIARSNGDRVPELLTPEQLAEKLKLPLSWVYEQSRLENIPTHKLGRYSRFDLAEVLRSQREKREAPLKTEG